MENLPVLQRGSTHGGVKVHKDLLLGNTKYRKTQRARHLWVLVQGFGQMAHQQQGPTSGVRLGLRENSGPRSVFSRSGSRTCARELSHVLIFPAASCKEKNQRFRKVPALKPYKSFLHLLSLQITCLQKYLD